MKKIIFKFKKMINYEENDLFTIFVYYTLILLQVILSAAVLATLLLLAVRSKPLLASPEIFIILIAALLQMKISKYIRSYRKELRK